MTDACLVSNLAKDRPTRPWVSRAIRSSSRSRVARDRRACVSQNSFNSSCTSDELRLEAGA